MSIYIGDSSKARQVRRIYIGINNIARTVHKVYIGVNGVARLVYSAYIWKKYTCTSQMLYCWAQVRYNVLTGWRTYGYVYSTDRYAYPDQPSGWSDGYMFLADMSKPNYEQGEFVGIVTDIISYAYPSNGRHTDGYWYIRQ